MAAELEWLAGLLGINAKAAEWVAGIPVFQVQELPATPETITWVDTAEGWQDRAKALEGLR